MTTNKLSRPRFQHYLRSGLFTAAILLSAGYTANAQSLTWDPIGTPATGSQASGTWSPSGTGASNWSNGTVDQTWLDGDAAVFGPTGAVGTATVAVGGTVTSTGINFTATGYTLTGGTVLFQPGNDGISINLATSGLNEEIDSNIGLTLTPGGDLKGVVATGSTLTLTGGINNSLAQTGKALSFGGGGTVILTSAPSNTTAFSTSYNVGGGLFLGSGAVIQQGNTIVVNGNDGTGAINANLGQGDGVPGGSGSYTVNSAGALLNGYNVNVGQGNNYLLDVESGVAEVGSSLGIGTDDNTSRTTAITDTLKVGGTGQLASNATINIIANKGTAQIAVLQIDGGVTVASQGIVVGGSTGDATSSATLNVTGGKLFVGNGGITSSGAAAKAVNFSGGTIGATADWSSSLNITLANKTTFQTSDTGATINAPGAPTNIYTYNATGAAHNITLNGVLSGTGGLMVTGPGILALSGANTYSGNTEVASGADLNLLSNLSLAFNSTLTLDDASNSFVDLNFTGADTIAGLTIGGVVFGPGTYDAGDFTSGIIDGAGSLIVTGAVPEPTTWVMMLSGLILLIGVRRVRSKGC